MAEFTVSELNKENITNLYLYGELEKPTNLVDDNLIRRPDEFDEEGRLINPQATVNVDAVQLMETGPGRFAVPAQFELVQRFFDPSFDPTPGEYLSVSKSVLNQLYFNLPSISWQMRQVNYDDGQDNLTERAYIWNNMAFQIADDSNLKFVIEPDGTKKIENFSAYPRLDNPDNFDFTTSGLAGIVANDFLEPRIDPSRIGRTVNINFDNIDRIEPIEIYTENDFYQDLKPSEGGVEDLFTDGDIETRYFIDLVTAGSRIFPERNQFIDELFQAETIRFLDDSNRPILYGTLDNDLLLTAASITPTYTPTLHPFKNNGVVLIGAAGNDNIVGASAKDLLLGGEGLDTLDGNQENDVIRGGSENDKLIGGSGADELDGGDGNDNLDGGRGDDLLIGGKGSDTIDGGEPIFGFFQENDSVSYSGTFAEYDISFLADDSVRITDNVNNRDAIDLMNDVELAVFNDKTVNLRPGLDIAFVIDTTGSMGGSIGAVKSSANQILNSIFDSALDSRVAVVGYNDPGTNTFLSFTEQPDIKDRKSAARSAINSVSANGGGDFPEAVNAGLIRALNGGAGDWRTDASARRIILFGDAPPKDTDLRAQVLSLAANVGVSTPSGASALLGSDSSAFVPMSIEGEIETSRVSDGLAMTTFALETTNAEGSSVTVPVEIFTISIGGDATTRADFESLATATGGQAFAANDSGLVNSIIEAIEVPTGLFFTTDEDTSIIIPKC